MGILRLGLIAAIGVALLPSDSEQQEILYNRAAMAAHWTVTFCERNGQTCGMAGGLWEEFKKKAQFGARLAYDTLSEQLSAGDEPVAQATTEKVPAGTRVLETGTLTRSDLEPVWRGNGRPKASQRLDAR